MLQEAIDASRMDRLDVSADELEALLETRQEPRREQGSQKLKAGGRTLGYVTELLENHETTLAASRRLLCQAGRELRGREKNRKPSGERPQGSTAAGHGRNSPEAYRRPLKSRFHASFAAGDRCPDCQRGKSIRSAIPAC